MTMEWKNRDYRFGRNSRGSFQEHNRQMRQFRSSHADVALANGQRPDQAAYLEGLLFLRVNYLEETGGSMLPNGAFNGASLVPMRRVAGYRLANN